MYLEIKLRKFNENKVILRFFGVKEIYFKVQFSIVFSPNDIYHCTIRTIKFQFEYFWKSSTCLLCAKKRGKGLRVLHSCSAINFFILSKHILLCSPSSSSNSLGWKLKYCSKNNCIIRRQSFYPGNILKVEF